MTDDARMLRWWNDLPRADRDEWCKALAAADVSEPLGATIDADLRGGDIDGWLVPVGVDGGLSPYAFHESFRMFLESRCGTTGRG